MSLYYGFRILGYQKLRLHSGYGSHQFTANLDREIQSSIKFAMLLVFVGVDLTWGPVAQYGCRNTFHWRAVSNAWVKQNKRRKRILVAPSATWVTTYKISVSTLRTGIGNYAGQLNCIYFETAGGGCTEWRLTSWQEAYLLLYLAWHSIRTARFLQNILHSVFFQAELIPDNNFRTVNNPYSESCCSFLGIAIPRGFHKRTNFGQDRFRPIWQKPEGQIWRHVITASAPNFQRDIPCKEYLTHLLCEECQFSWIH